MTQHVDTKLAQIGNRSEEATGTVSPPIYLSTAYRHRGIGESTGFDYVRTKTRHASSSKMPSPCWKTVREDLPSAREWQPFKRLWLYLKAGMN